LLPGDPLLKDGWISSSWVGEGGRRGPDLVTFRNEAFAKLGFSPNFYAQNSCAPLGHCRISADAIRDNSTKLSELGYYDRVKVAAVNMSPDQVRGTITIVGSAPHESLFETKAPIETLVSTGWEIDPSRKKHNTRRYLCSGKSMFKYQ
jgi:hypothetical protein